MKRLTRLLRGAYNVAIVAVDPDYLTELEGRVDALCESLDRVQHERDKLLRASASYEEVDPDRLRSALGEVIYSLSEVFGEYPGYDDDYYDNQMYGRDLGLDDPKSIDFLMRELIYQIEHAISRYKMRGVSQDAFVKVREEADKAEARYNSLRKDLVTGVNPLLEERLSLLSENALLKEEISKQADVIEKLQTALEETEQALIDEEERSTEIDALADELGRELDELRGEYEEYFAKCEYLEDDRYSLKEEIGHLELQIENDHHEMDSLRAEVERLENALNYLKLENALLKADAANRLPVTYLPVNKQSDSK